MEINPKIFGKPGFYNLNGDCILAYDPAYQILWIDDIPKPRLFLGINRILYIDRKVEGRDRAIDILSEADYLVLYLKIGR